MYNETTRLVKVVMPVETEEDILQGETNPILASVNPTRAAGDSGTIMLSDTAENLFIAYEVVAMVKDEETGKTHFSQLRWKKLGTIEDEDGGEAKSVADPSGDGDGEQIGVKGAMRYDKGAATEEELPLYYQFMFESGDLFVAAAADEYPALDGDELQMLNDSSSGGGSGGGSTGGGVLAVTETASGDTYTLDKTWQEIYDAGIAFVTFDEEYPAKGLISDVRVSPGDPDPKYLVTIFNGLRPVSYYAETANDYPSYAASSSGPGIHV
jgi:hypothetical protein